MKVSVIGGSGFIGRHVVRHLLDAGLPITTIDRSEPPDPLPGERCVLSDLSTPDECRAAAAACGATDAVVWLAAQVRHRTAVDETARDDVAIMVEAPLRFLGALANTPSSFVHFSSIQVYGRPRWLPVDEAHPTEPFTAYGIAKLCAEKCLRIACRAAGTSLANFRMAFVYGPGQNPGQVIPRFLERLRLGKPPLVHGDGSGVRDDIYVADVARAVELAIRARADGCFNIAAGEPHRVLDLAEAACRVAGMGLRPRFEPAASNWIDRWYTVERGREAFGFAATTGLEEGLARMWSAGQRSA
jgi:UDP-glucose 4-epimerase